MRDSYSLQLQSLICFSSPEDSQFYALTLYSVLYSGCFLNIWLHDSNSPLLVSLFSVKNQLAWSSFGLFNCQLCFCLYLCIRGDLHVYRIGQRSIFSLNVWALVQDLSRAKELSRRSHSHIVSSHPDSHIHFSHRATETYPKSVQ